MLGPLAALAPQLLHPTEQRTIGQLWQQFDREAHPLRALPP
jgi:7,8-dihydro-6-hydroxymethylpterin-pyrophosphokinase